MIQTYNHFVPANQNLIKFLSTMGRRNDDEEEEEEEPRLAPADDEEESGESVYDSYDEDEGFEDQGSSDDDEDRLRQQAEDDDSDDDGVAVTYEQVPRSWAGSKRTGDKDLIHTEDLSSDDEDIDGKHNRIGRVPLHWYDEFEHIGYDAHGTKMTKSNTGDRIDQALAMHDNQKNGKFVVHDALNDRSVELTQRQIDLIRRVQAGAYAHPEHDGNPEYIDYYSGVDPFLSGLNSNRDPPKARFQPSRWEAMQIERLLKNLERGNINMDYLNGKVRDMNDANRKKSDDKAPFGLWTGDEDDLSMRKGPQHIAAPKLPPPGHAASYRPPAEYLPTEDELKQWEDLPAKDRPYGSMIPKAFDNLRSVGAYQHSVREAFERCLDLYLCPRVVKKRLNIDPESLVPKLPQAQDLRPFPTAKCILYKTPYEGDTPPTIRCVTSSPDGQFMASGAADGFLRLWEVQTGRLLRSWDLHTLLQPHALKEAGDEPKPTQPVVCVQWNPTHHVLLAAIGPFVVIIVTGTAGQNDAELTSALLQAATDGGTLSSTSRASKAVTWIPIAKDPKEVPIAAASQRSGAICALRMSRDVADCRWQVKGDYFCTVSPKAGAASVLVHQLSKGNSQQPFSKAKGENQLACFHPNKPFLFVASQQHVRIYHLVKQIMVKRLITGCRWISSMDIHSSGDHLIVGSLDRRVLWFDLDLGASPYKTLKYHERAVRSCRYARRYPLMASVSDDGVIHVFHSMVYNDLMKNPLIVPVKILRGHEITNKLGVLACCWHPSQPWLFTAGADGKIFLYQDI